MLVHLLMREEQVESVYTHFVHSVHLTESGASDEAERYGIPRSEYYIETMEVKE